MNCQRFQLSFLDAQSARLDPAESAQVSAHLQTCAECRRAWDELSATLTTLDRLPQPEPSPALRARFQAMLRDPAAVETATGPFELWQGRLDRICAALLPSRPALQAACLLGALVVGAFAGAGFLRPTAASAIGSAESAGITPEPAPSGAEFADLTQRSTFERLSETTVASRSTRPEQTILRELFGTVTLDPSTNVRLDALDSLYPYSNRPEVRARVRAVLPRDPSPLVQLSMINFLVGSRDEAAVPVLEGMLRDDQVENTVREAARRGLAQL